MIFLNWNGEGISDSNSPNTTVDMTQDRTISASYANGSSVASLFMSGGEIIEDEDAGINAATFSVRANGKSVSGFSYSLVTGPNGETGNNNLFSFQQIKKEHLRVRFLWISKLMALPYPSL